MSNFGNIPLDRALENQDLSKPSQKGSRQLDDAIAALTRRKDFRERDLRMVIQAATFIVQTDVLASESSTLPERGISSSLRLVQDYLNAYTEFNFDLKLRTLDSIAGKFETAKDPIGICGVILLLRAELDLAADLNSYKTSQFLSERFDCNLIKFRSVTAQQGFSKQRLSLGSLIAMAVDDVPVVDDKSSITDLRTPESEHLKRVVKFVVIGQEISRTHFHEKVGNRFGFEEAQSGIGSQRLLLFKLAYLNKATRGYVVKLLDQCNNSLSDTQLEKKLVQKIKVKNIFPELQVVDADSIREYLFILR